MRKTKKGRRKFSARFLAFFNQISTVQKIVLSSSQGQGNFRGLEALRPRPRTSKCVLEAKDVLEDSTSAYYLKKLKTIKLIRTHFKEKDNLGQGGEEILLEIGFIEETTTTSGSKELPQAFFHNSHHSQKYSLIPLTQCLWQPCFSQF